MMAAVTVAQHLGAGLNHNYFMNILGRSPCMPTAWCQAITHGLWSVPQEMVAVTAQRPSPSCSSASVSSQSHLGLEREDIKYRIFRVQYCTLLLYAEGMLCRLPCYFSEGTQGATALQHHFSIIFQENLSIFLPIDVQTS